MINIQTDKGFLVIDRTDESVGRLLVQASLSPAERARCEKITNPSRRREWLTWHAMLGEMLGEGISTDYAADGRPVLVGAPGHISVSHSRRLVALYYQPDRCGVDIEEVTRNFDRIAPRFLSPVERALPEAARIDPFPALVWCAKEAVYKYAGRPGLDLLRDIRIAGIDPAAAEVHARLLEKEDIVLKYRFLENHCLVYTTTTD